MRKFKSPRFKAAFSEYSRPHALTAASIERLHSHGAESTNRAPALVARDPKLSIPAERRSRRCLVPRPGSPAAPKTSRPNQEYLGATRLGIIELMRGQDQMAQMQISFATVYVSDQANALESCRDKLGFEVVTDRQFMPGFRWLTVAPKGSSTTILLAPAKTPMWDRESRLGECGRMFRSRPTT